MEMGWRMVADRRLGTIKGVRKRPRPRAVPQRGWITAALRSQLVSRLGRAETLKYGGAPCLRETRPPSTSENSRHCQMTIQLDDENSKAGTMQGDGRGAVTMAGRLSTLKRCSSWRIIGPHD